MLTKCDEVGQALAQWLEDNDGTAVRELICRGLSSEELLAVVQTMDETEREALCDILDCAP